MVFEKREVMIPIATASYIDLPVVP